jgi:hypothetical protein
MGAGPAQNLLLRLNLCRNWQYQLCDCMEISMKSLLLLAFALAAGAVTSMACVTANCVVSAMECANANCFAPAVVECASPTC